MTNQQRIEALRKAIPPLEEAARKLRAYEQPVWFSWCVKAAEEIQGVFDSLEGLETFDRPALIIARGHALKCADEARLHLAAYKAVCVSSALRDLRLRQIAAHHLKQLLEAVEKVVKEGTTASNSPVGTIIPARRQAGRSQAALHLVAESTEEATPLEENQPQQNQQEEKG